MNWHLYRHEWTPGNSNCVSLQCELVKNSSPCRTCPGPAQGVWTGCWNGHLALSATSVFSLWWEELILWSLGLFQFQNLVAPEAWNWKRCWGILSIPKPRLTYLWSYLLSYKWPQIQRLLNTSHITLQGFFHSHLIVIFRSLLFSAF